MSIRLGDKDILKLNRVLVIYGKDDIHRKPEQAVIYLEMPGEGDLPEGMMYANGDLGESNEKIQIRDVDDRRIVSIPVKGKLNLCDFDEIYFADIPHEARMGPEDIALLAKYVNIPVQKNESDS